MVWVGVGLGTSWSGYELVWVRVGLCTSWFVYELVWVRVGLRTSWSEVGDLGFKIILITVVDLLNEVARPSIRKAC